MQVRSRLHAEPPPWPSPPMQVQDRDVFIISNLLCFYISFQPRLALAYPFSFDMLPMTIQYPVFLPLSVGIVATLIFALIAGLNQIDTFKAHIMDMGKEEAESNMGKLGQNSPFSMWKTVYTLTYTIFALAQLYQIWL